MRKLAKALIVKKSSSGKEAEKITLPALPKTPGFRAWRINMRNAVVAASGKGNLAFQWIREVEEPGTTYESMADSGEFSTLDVKLAASITAIAHGELGRKITNETEKEAKENH
jgi:hypothetical protein